MTARDIAIVGLGCAFPQSANVREFWRINANGIDCIEPLPSHRLSFLRNWNRPTDHEAYVPPHRGGFLPQSLGIDAAKFGVPPNLVRHGDADQFLMLYVIDQALHDARLAASDPRRERTDVIVGRGNYPTYKLYEFGLRNEYFDATLELLERRFPEDFRSSRREDYERYLLSTLPPPEADTVSTAISNLSASRAANRLNLRGSAHCVDAACASGLIAVEQAIDRLRLGKADVVVAASLFLTQTTPFLYVFNKLGALSPSGMIRPMDRRADGLLIGEGGGAIVLKRLDDAVADGDEIYAIIKGAGSASDGRDVDVLAPSPTGQRLALERAYADAQVDPATIGYLELHGTGTVVGDEAELHTVRQFFGTTRRPPTARAMGSVKSLIGHCMPASGLAAIIRTALALSNKILPPSLHCEEPRPELTDAPFYVNPQTRPWVQNERRGPRRAAVNSFGFGGINGHIILEEAVPTSTSKTSRSIVPRPIEPGVDRPTEVALFSSPSLEGICQQLKVVLRFLTDDFGEKTAADVAWSLAQAVDLSHPCKLAVIFATLDELAEQLQSWLRQTPGGADLEGASLVAAKSGLRVGADADVYFSSSAAEPPGKVAFVFPGMGFPGLIGNYPDHVLELCVHHPNLRREFDVFEERDRHPEDDVPTSAVFVPPATLPEEYRQQLKSRLAPPKADVDPTREQQPEERYLAAMGVTLVNWIGWTLLEPFGIPVELMAGQSQGEMAAVCAAGMSDFHATAPAYWKVLNINPRYGAGSCLGFAWASEEQVRPLLDENPTVSIAIHMSPSAVILGGERSEVTRVLDQLKRQQHFTQLMPYPPIHTPCLSHLREEMDRALHDHAFRVRPGKIRLYSSITAAPYPTTEAEVRETLMLNLDQPLRVWQTMRRLYDDGARVFLQVGGGHMSAHLQEFLPADSPVVTVALDVDARNPLTQLNHLVGTLFTAGVPMSFDPLFKHRRAETLDLTAPRPAAVMPKTFQPLRLEWSPLGSLPRPTVAAPETAASEQPSPPLDFDIPFPVLGRIVHLTPEHKVVIERELDIDEDLFLHDHLFVYAPFKPPQDCLPVVPLTMSLEWVAESAALLCPGLGLIGFENVRAGRWIGLEDGPRKWLTITATTVQTGFTEIDGVRAIDVAIDLPDKRGLTARVLFAAEYRETLRYDWPDLSTLPGWPCAEDESYGPARRMFHGPRFHVVSALDRFSNPVCTAKLRALPRDDLFRSQPKPALLLDPCLLDGIGQILGLWCQMHDWMVVPTGVERIEIYGSTPAVGTEIEIRVLVTDFDIDRRQVLANVELSDGAGGVWLRCDQWGDWIDRTLPAYPLFRRNPFLWTVAQPVTVPGLPVNVIVVTTEEGALSGVELSSAWRTILAASERPAYHDCASMKAQRQFLISRLVAKDAARLWRRQQTGETLWHPAALAITHDDQNRPVVSGFSDGPVPQIDEAYHDKQLVAVAATGPVAIQLVSLAEDSTRETTRHPTLHEQTLLQQHVGLATPAEGLSRWRCAMGAVQKLRGDGSDNRPLRLHAISSDSCFIVHDEEDCGVYEVYTARVAGLVVGVARLADGNLDHIECQNILESIAPTNPGLLES